MAQPPPSRPQVLCVALVGKQNNPMYVRVLSEQMTGTGTAATRAVQQDLRFMYMVHTSLDVFEERTQSGSARATDTYLGLLFSLEDIRVYGYMTNTKIKFVVIVQGGAMNEGPLKDSELRQLFVRLHGEYTNLIYNPFFDVLGPKIVSPHFDRAVESLVVNSGL